MRKHDYKVVFDKEEGLLWLIREIRERIGIEMYVAYKFDPITGLNPTGYLTKKKVCCGLFVRLENVLELKCT